MYIYICVYIYMYIYICIYIYVYVYYIYMCVYIYNIHIYIYVRCGKPNKNHPVSWCFLGPWAVGIRSMVFKPGLTRLVFQMERHEAIDPSATPKTRFPGRKHSTNAPKNQLKIRFCLVSTRSSQMVIIYIYIYTSKQVSLIK